MSLAASALGPVVTCVRPAGLALFTGGNDKRPGGLLPDHIGASVLRAVGYVR